MSRIVVAALFIALSGSLFAAEEWDDDDWGDDSWGEAVDGESAAAHVQGFYELGLGRRSQNDPAHSEDLTLAEARARLELDGYLGESSYSFKGDLYTDGVEHGLKADLREALFAFSPTQQVDLRVGQQVLTWGTGDLLFLNDLFAKDWVSFFAGRDDGYLKAPSASLKASYYGQSGVNLDLVWTPVFTHDRFIDGERFSYFSPALGANVAAPDGKLIPEEPEKTLDNGELATRLFWQQDGTEWALYGYRGFWKQPNAMRLDNSAFFSRLNVAGASVRGNWLGGIANVELAYYDGEDSVGDDPLMPNNQLRALAGYERELMPKLTMGLQYYLEWAKDYAALSASDGNTPYRSDEYRHLLTLRLNYRLMQDNLILSWFGFWSPSDEDYYLRPSAKYRIDDAWSVTVGANIFGGRQRHSFFGQFEDASNIYARLRYAY